MRRLAAARELDLDRRHIIYGGKRTNFKFGFYLCVWRNFIIILNLMNLYIKLCSVTLFLKFSKFETFYIIDLLLTFVRPL